MIKILKFITRSSTETKKAGQSLGRCLRRGDVVALAGSLGAGKTTFVKGVAKGLGVRSEKQVSSPTFVLIHEYRGRFPVFHLDWYRLDRVEGSDAALAEECFEAKGATLVEWPERGRGVIPKKRIDVKISHRGPASRIIEIRSSREDLLRNLRKTMAR